MSLFIIRLMLFRLIAKNLMNNRLTGICFFYFLISLIVRITGMSLSSFRLLRKWPFFVQILFWPAPILKILLEIHQSVIHTKSYKTFLSNPKPIRVRQNYFRQLSTYLKLENSIQKSTCIYRNEKENLSSRSTIQAWQNNIPLTPNPIRILFSIWSQIETCAKGILKKKFYETAKPFCRHSTRSILKISLEVYPHSNTNPIKKFVVSAT